MIKLSKFILGQEVRDIVTGFVGIAVNRIEYLNGCTQYLVKPPCVHKDGEPMKQSEGCYIDDQSLELVSIGIAHSMPGGILPDVDPAPTGGPDVREGELPT